MSFWRGRRVFLTGHTGFKGAWLSLWLQQLGAHVTGFALAPPTTPSLFAEARLAPLIHSLEADIRDLPTLQQALTAAQPELVLHLAAQSLVRPSYQDPAATFATNVMGTVHTLEAARHCPCVRAILVVTSDKCYENREWPWPYRETDPLGGHDPYSNSKACAELVTASYRSSFFSQSGVAVASARAGNVIGGGDWALDRLLPDAVRAFNAGNSLRIRNPHAIRPWQHVLEPLRGYLALAQALLEPTPGGATQKAKGHPDLGSQPVAASDADPGSKSTKRSEVPYDTAWNFGPPADAVQPVQAVIELFAHHWSENAPGPAADSRIEAKRSSSEQTETQPGHSSSHSAEPPTEPAASPSRPRWTIDPGPHPHEAHTLRLDCSRANAALHWHPVLTFAESIAWTAEWYARFLSGEDARAVTLEQIARYQATLDTKNQPE